MDTLGFGSHEYREHATQVMMLLAGSKRGEFPANFPSSGIGFEQGEVESNGSSACLRGVISDENIGRMQQYAFGRCAERCLRLPGADGVRD